MASAETRSQIAFEELGLGAILSRYRLRVPPNQREYAWKPDLHVTPLLHDFARAIDDDGPYFLGTIVTIPRGEGELEVVDGQQRLATTALLLTAIRNYLIEHGEPELAGSIDNDFLWVFDRERRERIPRLTLNVDDNSLFERIVTGEDLVEPSRASHERLLAASEEARRHVRRILSPLDERDHAGVLNRWIAFIQYRALVVLLRVPAEHDAYRMFETLNDRGLRTSQADLVKNYLFGRAGSRINEAQSRWSYMRGALESGSDDDDITITFLRHALIVQSGFLRDAQVYEKTQSLVKSEQTAVSFGGSLETLAGVYVATLSSDHERWNPYPDSVRRAVEVLNLFNIKPMRPLLLAVAATMSENEAAKTYNFLIALGVRLIIAASTRSGSVEEPIAEAGHAVYNERIGDAAGIRTALDAITPTDAVFKASFQTARVSSAKLARYYLRSLEMQAQAVPEPWFIPQEDKAVINLEHVLPKKAEGNWPTFTDDEAARLPNRLGNMALLNATTNSDLKSKAFSEKRAVYSTAPYVLTSQIAEVDTWTPDAIEKRQAVLADLAVETWDTDL